MDTRKEETEKKEELEKKDKKNMEKGVFLYGVWWEVIKDYSDNIRLAIYDAVMEYGLKGKLPEVELEGLAQGTFNLIQPFLDSNKESYKRRCATNQINGLKGGAPMGNKNAEKQPKTTLNKNKNKNKNKNISQKIEEEQNKIFATYQIWLAENAAYCANPENFEQLTADELWDLANKYNPEKIKEVILNIESKKPVSKKGKALYKILNDFLKKTNKIEYF